MKKFKQSIVTALLLSFVALLAVGCGDSRDDFVATNTNNANTGALNFQFVRARTTTIADSTTDLLFEFRNAANELVLSTTVPFASPATTVTITGIPASATQVEITALQNGFPVGSVTDTVTIVVGQTGNVDLSNATNNAVTYDSLTVTPDPTNLEGGNSQTLALVGNFSDSSSVTVANANATYTSNNTMLANVSASGVISTLAQTGGNTTVDVAWTFNSVERTDTVTVNVASIFFTQDELTGVAPANLRRGEDYDLEDRFLNSLGESFGEGDGVTYTIVPATTGVSIADGDDIRIDGSVALGTNFQVQVSGVDSNTNITHTATSPVITVIEAQP